MDMKRVVFVHGSDGAGAAAWPEQHLLAGRWDCLFLRRSGHEVAGQVREPDVDVDAASILSHLAAAGGGHLVAHDVGAVSALLAAVRRPDLVRSLTLFEPAAFALTRDLSVTAAHLTAAQPAIPPVPAALVDRDTRPDLGIVPGVPTLVVTGGWEPLYEEVAGFLASTGARHVVAGRDHRPQDDAEGHAVLTAFLTGTARAAA
ncbi:alpha/beta fold hydrolase [Tersicoccus solisilvae]|uniref:alpha/beta fold hydrolase n=1 Tax=Tersicoccus solisilvae TaxID=1882339 RepID=UPI001664F555|nr:alpha/beta hydrolase [Tersicoccus solisilvae]